MTLKEAINNGSLPNFGDKKNENKYKKLGKLLGLSIDNLDYEVTDDDLDRMKYNYEINLLLVQERIRKSHNKVLNNYDELINKYKNLSKEMEKKYAQKGKNKQYYLKDASKDLNKLIKEIEKVKNNYEKNLNNVNLSRDDLKLNEESLSIVDNKVLDVIEHSEKAIDKKLSSKYEELNELENVEYKTNFMKKINEEKIKRVKERIKRLQNKQGFLQSKQQRIINKGIEKYRSIKQNKINEYLNKIEKVDEYQKVKVQIREEQESNNNDINELDSKIKENNKGLFSKFKKIPYEVNKKTLERKREHLKNKEKVLEHLRKIEKQGTVTFGAQIYKYVAKTVYGL